MRRGVDVRRSLLTLFLCCSCLSAAVTAGCAAAHGDPLLGGEKPPEQTGTLSGVVRAEASNVPLSARRITITNLDNGETHETSTAANGGYTIKLPMGRYRVSVQLNANELVKSGPDELVINRSDVDSGRDFIIAVKP